MADHSREPARAERSDTTRTARPRTANYATGAQTTSLLVLQRGAGNQAVTSLLQSHGPGVAAVNAVQRLGNEQGIPSGLLCERATDPAPAPTDTVLFPNAVSSLSSSQLEQIQNLVYNWHAAGDQPQVRVDGYASPPGEDALNWQLACERACAISAELEHPTSGDPGIPAGSIIRFMHGETNEFGSESENRRGSIFVEVGRPAPGESPVESPWWPNGPTIARKVNSTPLAQYVAWVREVEAVYGDREDVVSRLRRLYFSEFVARAPEGMNAAPVAGPRFDQLIAGAESAAPMTSPPLSLTALDGLFGTDTVRTPAGESIDPSHIMPALDLELQGASVIGKGGGVVGGVDLLGLFTWTGDLGAWFVEWMDQKRAQPGADDMKLLLSCVSIRTSLDDLLSDMDAQIMAENEVTTAVSTTPAPATAMEPIETITTTLNRPLSDTLESYYGAAGQATPSPDRLRFGRFVQAAVPHIPHITRDPSKPLEIGLAPNAEEEIYEAVYATTELLIEGEAALIPGTPDVLEDNDRLVREIARRFHAFLETGLTTGSATWP